MCGIAGFCRKRIDNVSVIQEMNARMIHRGPDSGGYYIDDRNGMTLGHRRLSILDLSDAGCQPMTSRCERFVMVYNGEIYNSEVIRKKLIDGGHVDAFRGTSDTEVLLEAIIAYGIEQTCQMITGMFAFAIYDREDRSITLARDRIGEKPLYYGHVKNEFIFASDLDVIRAYPGFDNPINKTAVQRFLRYSYIPAPMTIYDGLYKLNPGSYIVFEEPYISGNQKIHYDVVKEYQYGMDHPFTGTFEEATDALESCLKSAVKSQLMADVPLGAFLSGGIDSSTIVALMQSMVHEPVKTFTIGFEDKKYNEADESAIIAKHLGTDHTSLIVSDQELIDVVPKLSDIFSEPFADSSQIPTYLVSKLARSKVTVSLSGDAGDELFGGYNTYWKIASLYSKVRCIPRGLRYLAGTTLKSNHNNMLYRIGNCLMADDIANLHEAVAYADNIYRPGHINQHLLLREGATPQDEMMVRDLHQYHPDDILVKVDRSGMAVSLENRVPMLDKEVLRLAYSLPLEFKIATVQDKLVTKRVLKSVLYRYVPQEIADRPKKGFSVPLDRWLHEGTVHEMAWDILEDSKLALGGIIDGNQLKQLMRIFITKGKGVGILWNYFILEQWYRKNYE